MGRNAASLICLLLLASCGTKNSAPIPDAGAAKGGAPVPPPKAAAPDAALPDLASGAVRFVETVLEWLDRWCQRQHLMALDDHLLQDIGVSRSEAEREFRKPFWRD